MVCCGFRMVIEIRDKSIRLTYMLALRFTNDSKCTLEWQTAGTRTSLHVRAVLSENLLSTVSGRAAILKQKRIAAEAGLTYQLANSTNAS